MDKVQLVSAISIKREKHILLIIEDNDRNPPEYYGFATWAQPQKLDYFNTPQELFMRLIKELPMADMPFEGIRYSGEIFIDQAIITKYLE